MSLRTLVALMAFAILTASLMLDKNYGFDGGSGREWMIERDPQGFRQDFSLSSGDLASFKFMPKPGPIYLIPPAEIYEFQQHGVEVILNTLDAFPDLSTSVLAASDNTAESKSVNQ